MNVNTDSRALRDLTIDSLKRASDSFGFMIRHKVELREITLEEIKDPSALSSVISEDMYMLTTEIIGDMKGKSYLFFGQKVADKVFELCTGMKVGSSSLGVDAVLKEIDNIVSASMISVIADRLKVVIYGDVPYCFEYSVSEIGQVLKKDFHQYAGEHDQYLIKCEMIAAEADLKVDFLWVLSGDIVSRLVD